MKLIHEYKAGSWGDTIHRLVAVEIGVGPDGTSPLIAEGDWAGYEHPCFLTYADIYPGSGSAQKGWMGYTDYYLGSMPELITFEADHVTDVETQHLDDDADFGDEDGAGPSEADEWPEDDGTLAVSA
ncbi:hypothetical protein BcepSauron_158 [Burkholderia phage BcepSauron]|uniref:Uncharacterized protein n=1 Tax=Burkholderia phage BcepSauron TaxID=2530033 RepID=A0A482MLM4_9CAUD|nr:hypothetical protein H1O17_gp158 [Burkholderia phage BcepSauron]QBQ74538.1 hypothetical protein BcepSauron_158 [Burkholderia phage BcepSauron]